MVTARSCESFLNTGCVVFRLRGRWTIDNSGPPCGSPGDRGALLSSLAVARAGLGANVFRW